MTRKHDSQTNDADMLKEVSNYYAEKLSKHGSSAQGVDWNSETSQTKRFEQLCKVIDLKSGFSINDFGCGYGALFSFLAETFNGFEYFGNDVSKEMISAANLRYSENPRAHFQVSSGLSQAADFTVASGIFNVRLSNSDQDWDVYIEKTLDLIDKNSLRGFSFNCLTKYSDVEKKRDYLYYADPCKLFDTCKRKYSSQVALLHDYGLYEFTILVRKQT